MFSPDLIWLYILHALVCKESLLILFITTVNAMVKPFSTFNVKSKLVFYHLYTVLACVCAIIPSGIIA